MTTYFREGDGKNLVVVLSRYHPAVACFGPKEAALTVGQDLLDLIPTDYSFTRFGYEGEPGVNVVLPYTLMVPFESGKTAQCTELALPLTHDRTRPIFCCRG